MASYYTPEEAEAILTRAAGRQSEQTVSHSRLLAMAEELGISPDEVEAAVAEVTEEAETLVLRRAFIAERRGTLVPHLIPYVCVSVFLILINVMTGGSFWAIYPILGWGIGVASHMAAVLPTRGPVFETEFANWRKVREKKAQRTARRAAKKAEAAANADASGVTKREQAKETDVRRRYSSGEEEKSQVIQQQAGR